MQLDIHFENTRIYLNLIFEKVRMYKHKKTANMFSYRSVQRLEVSPPRCSVT